MKFLPIVGAPYAKKATLLRHGYDMASPAAQDAYLNALRRALLHLYDPVELRRSPLFDLFGLPAGADRVGALRRTLHDAIQALKPARQVPGDSHARRIYEILTYRYIEQSSQKEVAADLALSIRQLQRLEGMALEALAAYLSERYALSPERLGMLDGHRSGPVEDPVEAQDEPAASERLAQELAWLERSSHPEEIDIQALLVEIMETLSPLIEKQSVEVVVNFPTPPPCLVGDSAILRPAFLTLLSAFLQECPKAQVKFTGRTQEASFAIDIWVKGDQKKPTGAGQAAGGRLAGERDLLQQLFRLAGGELEIFPSMPGHPPPTSWPGCACRGCAAEVCWR